MPKNIPITSEIEAQLRERTGDASFDASEVVVFETVMLSTRPLNKRGSLYDKAQVTRKTLMEMAEFFSEGQTLPLQLLHNGAALPKGRVFDAQVFDADDGSAELVGRFYMPTHEEELIANIQTSVIDSVSVGYLPKQILCSECDFDYLSEDADILNLITRTCENDHTVGVDGVHVRPAGLDAFFELSLVPRGASAPAKISSRERARLNDEEGEEKRLAASGVNAGAAVVFATCSDKETQFMSGDKGADGANKDANGLMALTEQIGDLRASIALKDKEIADLTTRAEAAEAKVTELQATVDGDDKATKLSEAEASLKSVTDFLKEHAKAAKVALGETDPKIPDDVTELIETVKDAGAKLHQSIGTDGRGDDAVDDADQEAKAKAKQARLGAFRTRKENH